MRSLNTIFKSLGVSKGDRAYAGMYEEVIGPRREEALQLFEIGILKGKSLRAWLEWLPNAHVTAIDTFARVPAEEVKVLEDPRITWFQRDSTWNLPEPLRGRTDVFDFIIDDGCHWHCAQRITFFRYWPLLMPGGTYFIEDVWPFDLLSEEEKLHSWLRQHPGAWTDDAFAGLMKQISVGEVRRHDFRHGENKDRYVMEVRKT